MFNNNSKKRRHAPPAAPDAVFRIVCPAAKTEDVATIGGDGAKILVEDLVSAEERVVVIVGEESAAQVALVRVFERTVDEESLRRMSMIRRHSWIWRLFQLKGLIIAQLHDLFFLWVNLRT